MCRYLLLFMFNIFTIFILIIDCKTLINFNKCVANENLFLKFLCLRRFNPRHFCICSQLSATKMIALK